MFQGDIPRGDQYDEPDPSADFSFHLGSQYGAYTQDVDSPPFPTQETPLPQETSLPQSSAAAVQQDVSYGPVYPTEDTREFIFGPGADEGPHEETLFGEIHEETPPQPPRQYTSLEERERQEEGRGKRLRREKKPWTPSSR